MSEEDFCPKCEDYRTTRVVTRDETYTIHGQQITLSVEVLLCTVCGESMGTDEEDQRILDGVYAKYDKLNEKEN